MSNTTFEVLETIHPKNVFPPINITPVLWHKGDFCGIERIEVRWPDELRLFMDKSLMEQMKAKLEEYDNYIQWLCQFVPEDRWDEVYGQITKMGIGVSEQLALFGAMAEKSDDDRLTNPICDMWRCIQGLTDGAARAQGEHKGEAGAIRDWGKR